MDRYSDHAFKFARDAIGWGKRGRNVRNPPEIAIRDGNQAFDFDH
jgi:hypothetical protein